MAIKSTLGVGLCYWFAPQARQVWYSRREARCGEVRAGPVRRASAMRLADYGMYLCVEVAPGAPLAPWLPVARKVQALIHDASGAPSLLIRLMRFGVHISSVIGYRVQFSIPDVGLRRVYLRAFRPASSTTSAVASSDRPSLGRHMDREPPWHVSQELGFDGSQGSYRSCGEVRRCCTRSRGIARRVSRC